MTFKNLLMIENKLNNIELRKMLRSFLRLKSTEEIISEIEDVFPINFNSLEGIQEYTRKYLVTYDGFNVFMKGIGELNKNSVYVTLEFRIEKKWWHRFKIPSANLIENLKAICTNEIDGLSFSKYTLDVPSQTHDEKNTELITYYHDCMAFNPDWEGGREISPLLIAPSENEKYHFVQFLFNSNCYMRHENKTILKNDWENHITDVDSYIQKRADEILKYGFKKPK